MKSLTDKQEIENPDNNLLNIYGFIGIVSFLPIWIFRGGLNYLEVTILFAIFFLIPFLIHLGLLKFLLKKKTKFYSFILSYYVSLISIHGVDQNLGLWSFILYSRKNVPFFPRVGGFLDNIGHIDYIYSIFSVFIFSLFICFFIFFLKKNGLKILAVFLVTVLLINVLDFRKNLSSFPQVDRLNNEYFNENLYDTNKTLVIILDEMSGINSFESNHSSGLDVKKNIINLFDKYKFAYYVNARSVDYASISIISTMLNFLYTNEQTSSSEKLAIVDNRKNVAYRKKQKLPIKISKNYFTLYELTSNKFFDLEKHNGIVVHQIDFLTYCEHYKVIKCHQFNKFDRENIYLEGFNNNLLSRALTIHESTYSILGKGLHRVGRYFGLTDTSIGAIGTKASFPQLLKKIENSLDVEKANLVFAHLDVPHRPYTYDENCKFDGGRQSIGGEKKLYNMTEEEMIIQHNLERNCVVYFLDIFLDNLRKQDYWEDLEIIIMSDHGSRITFNRNHQKEPLFNLSEFIEESFLSVIFAIKTKKIPSGSYDDNVTTNHLFFKFSN